MTKPVWLAVLIFVQFVPQTTAAAANGSAQPSSEPFQDTSQAITSTRFTTLDPKRIGIDFVHRPDFELQAADSLVGGGVCIGDYDGDLDLFVCGYAVPNRLYINQGNGRFVERGRQAGLCRPAK